MPALEATASVTAIGPPGSGKSSLLWRRHTQAAPKKLTIEVVEETLDKFDPNGIRVYGREELADRLTRVIPDPRWHLIASLDPDDTDWLFSVLCPPPRRDDKGYAVAVRGLVVFCGELRHIAGLGLPKLSPVKAAYLQGRHHWVTMHGATQHAADCDPCTRMAVDRVIFLRMQDDVGLSAVARATSSHIAELVAELPDFHSATCLRNVAYLADEKDTLYRMVNYRGATLWSRPIESPDSPGVPRSNGARREVATRREGTRLG